MPIRVRLTAAFAVAMVLVLAATGLFVYSRQRSNLDETIDAGLRSRSDDVAALVSQSGATLGPAHGPRLSETEESFVQVISTSGRLLDRTGGAGGSVLRPGEVRLAARMPILLDRRVEGVDGRARILARPASARGRRLVVVTGVQLEDRDDALKGLLRSFAIGGPLAVLVASAIVYALATAGFAPVEAMRRRAARISLDHGGERLPLPAVHDEIRRLGETLNDMLARLEASFERERRFVADASHELRTPVAVLKTELEAAVRTAGNGSKVEDSLAAALDETDHLAQLTEDLLLIARASDGRLPLRREELDVAQLLDRTQQRFADRARTQGRAITAETADGLRASLDPLRARQALANLVDNALRHGAGDIRLAGRREGDTLEIDVSDEGEGFSAELAPRAFERFARGDGGARAGGAGLGLAIVQAIAEAHGGTAAIVDHPAGATVRLRIPASGPAQ